MNGKNTSQNKHYWKVDRHYYSLWFDFGVGPTFQPMADGGGAKTCLKTIVLLLFDATAGAEITHFTFTKQSMRLNQTVIRQIITSCFPVHEIIFRNLYFIPYRKTLLLPSANSSKTRAQTATAQLGCPSDN